MLPETNASYRDKSYWDARYASLELENEGNNSKSLEKEEKNAANIFYDWFESIENTSELLDAQINETQGDVCSKEAMRLLMNGCGNSRLSERLVDRGYCHIMNIDYSEPVIDKMQRHYALLEKYSNSLKWLVQDVRTMTDLEDGSFDVVIDKGTLDVFYCQNAAGSTPEDPWNPSEAVRQPVLDTLRQVYRVLKPNGLFLYVTFGQPPFRKPLLAEAAPWRQLTVKNMNDIYFMYIMTK